MQYRSDSIIELTKAMLSVQKEMPALYKTGVQVQGKMSFKCVKLEHMLFVLLPIANKYNLFVGQEPRYNNSDVMIETLVIHTSGEWRSSLSFLWSKDMASTMNQQDLGKIMTYRCRQDLRAMFGIMTGDQDFDDGLDEFTTTDQPEYLTEKDIKELKDALKNDIELTNELLKNMKVSSLETIPYKSFDKAKDTIVKIKTTWGEI